MVLASIIYLYKNRKIINQTAVIIVSFYLSLIIIPLLTSSLARSRFQDEVSTIPTGADVLLVGLGVLMSSFVVFVYFMQRKKRELNEQF
ncbi:MAG: hypothetical protein ACW97W_18440 [Candidatus Hodarchaeales archaeon]